MTRSPASEIWTWAIGAKEIQRRSWESCRAEPETALKTGEPSAPTKAIVVGNGLKSSQITRTNQSSLSISAQDQDRFAVLALLLDMRDVWSDWKSTQTGMTTERLAINNIVLERSITEYVLPGLTRKMGVTIRTWSTFYAKLIFQQPLNVNANSTDHVDRSEPTTVSVKKYLK